MRSREFFFIIPPSLCLTIKKILLIANYSPLIGKIKIFPYLCPILRIMRSRISMRTRINIGEDNNRYKQYNTKNYAVSRQVFT